MTGLGTLAEGVGFEPTEACTSHAFEACPFGHSGILPGGRLAARANAATRLNFLKIVSGSADNHHVTTDVFGDLGAGPSPAWQVIESARRQLLTGELVLDTSPPTHVYLRDGEVYFAERSTDGGLGVRLLVEGVITRAQLQKGSLLVSGTEHLGRLFDRDQTIEREPIELCVELMTEELLVAVAEESVEHPKFHMFKRHASGIDRWLPRQVEIVRTTERVVEVSVAVPAEAVHVAPAEPVQVEATPVEPAPQVAAEPTPVPANAVAEVPVEPAPEPAPAPVAEVVPEPQVVVPAPEPEPVEFVPPRVPMSFEPPSREVPAVVAAPAPVGTTPFAPPRPTDATLQLPIISDLDVPEFDVPAPHPTTDAPFVAAAVAEPAPVEHTEHVEHVEPAQVEQAEAPAPAPQPVAAMADQGLDALVAASVADEVAEAVRRAFAAIDLSPS